MQEEIYKEDFEDKESEKIQNLLTPLTEVEENDFDFEDEDIEKESFEDPEGQEDKDVKKRVKRLSKLGSKAIVKGLDIGNANLCRKIAHGESALEYRADPEAIEDLTDIVEEILPKKDGKNLNIPIWMQLIIFMLIAFLPTMIAAFSDRSDNKEMKETKKKNKKLKQERKLLKKQLENQKIAQQIKNSEPTEDEKMKILTGSDTEHEN